MFKKRETDMPKDKNKVGVYVIGDKNSCLIVSDKGHFDFRVNNKSVFGKIFDSNDQGFVGDSPTFVVGFEDKRANYKYDKVQADFGRISLVSEKVTISFTVDTKKKELLAAVYSSSAQKEYVLCVCGQRISVNNPDFDKICDELYKSTKLQCVQHKAHSVGVDIRSLYLYTCFWNIPSDMVLSDFYTLQEYRRLVSSKRLLCISLPGTFSEKALVFAKNILSYSKYVKNTFGFGCDIAFYDARNAFKRFLEQNALKIYTGKEFELLRVCASAAIELSWDFAPSNLWNNKAGFVGNKRDFIKDNKKIAELQTGIMKAELCEKSIGSVLFSFKDKGSVLVDSMRLFANNGQKKNDLFSNISIVKKHAAAVEYQYNCDGYDGTVLVGAHESLPLMLLYVPKSQGELDLSFNFSISVQNIPLSSSMIRVKNVQLASVFTPMIYEKEKISLFMIKNEDKSGFSIVIGSFLSEKDAMLYKAMEKYPSAQEVKKELDNLKYKENLVCDSSVESLCRINRAISVCERDFKKAKSYIVWALCMQNIDGNLFCEGSAARALVSYLEKSNDKKILFLELPYYFDGKYTTKKENVYMHIMRAAECRYNCEDEGAIEYLKKIYYDAQNL